MAFPVEFCFIALLCVGFIILPFFFKIRGINRRKSQPTAEWILGDTLVLYDDDHDFGYTTEVLYKGLYKDKVIVQYTDSFQLIPKSDIERNISLIRRKKQAASDFLRAASENYAQFQKELWPHK